MQAACSFRNISRRDEYTVSCALLPVHNFLLELSPEVTYSYKGALRYALAFPTEYCQQHASCPCPESSANMLHVFHWSSAICYMFYTGALPVCFLFFRVQKPLPIQYETRYPQKLCQYVSFSPTESLLVYKFLTRVLPYFYTVVPGYMFYVHA